MTNCLLRWKSTSSHLAHYACKSQGVRFLFLFVLTLCSSALFAQQTVSGRVVAGDSALAGVTVQVKGGSAATQTDENGAFSISAPATGTLVFSNVGFTTQEVRINNRTSLTVQIQGSA